MSEQIEGCPQPETPIRDRAWTAEQVERRAPHFENAGILDVAAMLRAFASTLRKQAEQAGGVVSDEANWNPRGVTGPPIADGLLRNGSVAALLDRAAIAMPVLRNTLNAAGLKGGAIADELLADIQAVAPSLRAPGGQGGRVDEAQATIDAVCDALGIGSAARSRGVIVTNVRNARRRSECLSAIEREFTVEVPDEDGDEGDTTEECPLRWGDSPEQYIGRFREAMAALAQNAAIHPTEDRYQHFLSYSGLDDSPWIRYAYFQGADVGVDRPLHAEKPALAQNEQGEAVAWQFRVKFSGDEADVWSGCSKAAHDEMAKYTDAYETRALCLHAEHADMPTEKAPGELLVYVKPGDLDRYQRARKRGLGGGAIGLFITDERSEVYSKPLYLHAERARVPESVLTHARHMVEGHYPNHREYQVAEALLKLDAAPSQPEDAA